MKRYLTIAAGMVSLYFMTPFFAFAQGVSNQTRNLDDFLLKIAGWINTLLPIVVALALLYFLWGLVKYVVSSGDAREEAKGIMIWGIIALFVMVSVWGLVAFLGNTLGISSGGNVDRGDIPTVDLR